MLVEVAMLVCVCATPDPVPLSTSVSTTLHALTATEVLVDTDVSSEQHSRPSRLGTVQAAPPEGGLYHIANDYVDFEPSRLL